MSNINKQIYSQIAEWRMAYDRVDNAKNEVNTQRHKVVDIIVRQCKDKKLSQRAIAKHLGVTPAYISDICRGQRALTMEIALKIEKLLNR